MFAGINFYPLHVVILLKLRQKLIAFLKYTEDFTELNITSRSEDR